MNILLVDSNKKLCYDLRNLLSMYRSFQVLDTFLDTTEQAAEYIDSHEVDVVFINNQPADFRYTSQGTSLANYLVYEHPDIQVVVYADSEDAAYPACRSQCAGFLLTPFDPLALQPLVDRLTYIYDLQQAKREAENRSVMFKTHAGYQLIRVQDILFIEHANRKNQIFTETGQKIELLGYSLTDLEKLLEKRGFFRCQQSFIVNLSKVSAIHADNDKKKYFISFKDIDGRISLSREKYMAMVSLLRERFMGFSG